MISAWEVIPRDEGWYPLIQGWVPPGTTPGRLSWQGGKMCIGGQTGSILEEWHTVSETEELGSVSRHAS